MAKVKSNTREKHKTKEVALGLDPGELRSRAAQLHLSDEQLLDMFRTMCTIRHFEYMADKLYAMGEVHGTMHLSARQIGADGYSPDASRAVGLAEALMKS